MHQLLKVFKYFLFGLVVISLVGIAVAWKNNLPFSFLKAKYANSDSQFTQIAGSNVHFKDIGNKNDSLPLVLIHGTGASLHTWEGWSNALKKEKRIITLDLPGYGLTGPNPQEDYSVDLYVKVVDSLLIKLGIEKCILGGNSLGGAVSWNYALKYPSKVSKLILVDAGGYIMKSKSVPLAFKMAQWPIINSAFLYITPRFVIEKSVKNVYYDEVKVTDKLIDRYFELALREGNRKSFIIRMTQNKIATEDISELIKTIRIPTLVLWGENDKLIPLESAHKFHADLPNDTLVILPKLGHTPMEEDPIATSKVVKDFFKKY